MSSLGTTVKNPVRTQWTLAVFQHLSAAWYACGLQSQITPPKRPNMCFRNESDSNAMLRSSRENRHAQSELGCLLRCPFCKEYRFAAAGRLRRASSLAFIHAMVMRIWKKKRKYECTSFVIDKASGPHERSTTIGVAN